MIELRSVDKVYRTGRLETLALAGISLCIQSGEFISVMGPSGSGKSTLLNVMGLLDSPTRGDLYFNDMRVGDLSDRERAGIRNTRIGFIFQSFHLIRDLPLIDNVEIPLLYRRISGRERHRRCREVLERVGLGSRIHHKPGQLSGGQQQRAAIARAIVGDPQLILADEPTGNLDSQMGDEIMTLLQQLHSDSYTAIVMVTHDARLADQTQRIVRLFDGRQVH
jgi:putative ABC transport system ATP-binding protein